jgi:peroxiredoxin
MRFLLTFCLCAAALLLARPAAAQNLSGRRAPSFSLPDSKLVQHDILDSRGKWLLMEFMETNCPFCKELSKGLAVLRTKYPTRVDVYGVVLPPDNQQTVAGYIAETKINFPILFDSSQTAIPFFKATPQNAAFDTPHLFAIDPNGQIARDWNAGFARDAKARDQMLKDVEALINAPSNTNSKPANTTTKK